MKRAYDAEDRAYHAWYRRQTAISVVDGGKIREERESIHAEIARATAAIGRLEAFVAMSRERQEAVCRDLHDDHDGDEFDAEASIRRKLSGLARWRKQLQALRESAARDDAAIVAHIRVRRAAHGWAGEPTYAEWVALGSPGLLRQTCDNSN
jgi:hypothetical protein